MNNNGTNWMDAGALGVWIASLADILPAIAALFSIVWFALRIMESRTVQTLLGRYAWIKETRHDED